MICCTGCAQEQRHQAKGLCSRCYSHHWRKNNAEKIKRNMHEYYLRRKAEDYEGIKRRNRESYQRNQEKVLARMCIYRKQNKERRREQGRLYYERNKERILEQHREWHRQNNELFKDYACGWNKANPDKMKARKARRRARKAITPDTLTPNEIKELFVIGEATYPGRKLELDHIVPLSKGGGSTRANTHMIPAGLNRSKHNKLPEEIYAQQPLGLALE